MPVGNTTFAMVPGVLAAAAASRPAPLTGSGSRAVLLREHHHTGRVPELSPSLLGAAIALTPWYMISHVRVRTGGVPPPILTASRATPAIASDDARSTGQGDLGHGLPRPAGSRKSRSLPWRSTSRRGGGGRFPPDECPETAADGTWRVPRPDGLGMATGKGPHPFHAVKVDARTQRRSRAQRCQWMRSPRGPGRSVGLLRHAVYVIRYTGAAPRT